MIINNMCMRYLAHINPQTYLLKLKAFACWKAFDTENTACSFSSPASKSKDFWSTHHRAKIAGLFSNLYQMTFCGSCTHEFNPPLIKLCFLGCLNRGSHQKLLNCFHISSTSKQHMQLTLMSMNLFQTPPIPSMTASSLLFQ